MPTWPSSLPEAPLLQGFSETPPETVVRTQMEAGPAKIRRRFSAGVRRFTMQFSMTQDQVAAFDDFFQNDCAGGSLAFDFTHPRTKQAHQFRFQTQPRYEPLTNQRYTVIVEMEQLP